MGKFKIKHGRAGTPEHRIWKHIRGRCNNTSSKDFKDYGGRGIAVCERWESFENFYADMGDRPSPQHSIERRDNNGGYSPSNCYWATLSEQANNKRSTRYVDFEGHRLSLAEACRRAGKSDRYSAIYQRISAGKDFCAALQDLAEKRTGNF